MRPKASTVSVQRSSGRSATTQRARGIAGKARAEAVSYEDDDTSGDTRPIAAVGRALSVLSAFRSAPRLSLSELSKRTGLFKSTLLRILATLERDGYMMRLADGQYCVGGIVFELGSSYAASFQIEDIIRPALEELTAATGETTAFYVRAGQQRQCLFRVDSPQAVRHVLVAGQIMDLNDAACSLLLLQYEKDGRRPAADVDYATLCRSTSGRGDAETASVAAPIFDTRGFLGVINISGPVNRFTCTVVAQALSILSATAVRLTRALGGNGPAQPGSGAQRG